MVDSAQASPRHVPLERCFNVRDVGGYPTRDGRIVRWGRLYRGGGPHGATAADAALLRDLSLTTIIDLRTVDETNERGSYAPLCNAPAVHHLPMTDVLPTPAELARWVDATFVGDHYFDMLTGGRAAITEALSIMSDADAYPVLMHCSAGKDRTGVLVAIVLGVLGVDDKTIIADYALSAGAMTAMLAHYERTVPEARERLAAHRPAVLSAEPATMARFLELVRAGYGSFEGLTSALGVAADVPSLQAALLART